MYVKLTIAELEECCENPEWVDVCKDRNQEVQI